LNQIPSIFAMAQERPVLPWSLRMQNTRRAVLGGAGALVIAMATGCFMTADPSLYEDGPRVDGGTPDAPVPDAPVPDAPVPDAPVVDLHGSDAPLADGPLPDLGAPDLLATYYRTWVTASVTAKPDKLWSPKAVYQGSTGKVLLYGGTDPSQAVVAKMWSYDGTTWTKLCDPCPPGPRVGHGMVWDAKRDIVVLFGGKGPALMNDLWELTAGVWQQLTPAGTGPSVRWGVYMAYDPLRDRTVVFGGLATGSVRMDDLYEYDGASWHGPFLPTVRPAGRTNYGSPATFADGTALAVAARNRVVIFGGEILSGVNADDCWAWDGTSWTPICTACTLTPRSGAALGFDPATGRLVLVNGWSGTGEIAGTFERMGQGWVQTTTLPDKNDHSAMVFDTARNRFVLIGGNGPSCGGNCDETLEYVAP
jgi:hypothetical protein